MKIVLILNSAIHFLTTENPVHCRVKPQEWVPTLQLPGAGPHCGSSRGVPGSATAVVVVLGNLVNEHILGSQPIHSQEANALTFEGSHQKSYQTCVHP